MGTRNPNTRTRPKYPGIYWVVLALYPIQTCTIRVLPLCVPGIKIPESVYEKMGIYTIRIQYPMGIPDPFPPLDRAIIRRLLSYEHFEGRK